MLNLSEKLKAKLDEGVKGQVDASQELKKAAKEMKLTFRVKTFGVDNEGKNPVKATLSIKDVIDQYINFVETTSDRSAIKGKYKAELKPYQNFENEWSD